MLQHLSVRNLAIIDQLDIEFQKGLNILSGETGAGKSILVQALELIYGERATSDLIRSGEEECEVTAVFDLAKTSEVSGFLAERGYSLEEILILRRVFNRSGRSKVYLNDRPATVALLVDLQKYLLEIVGQHASQELLIEEMPRSFLDSFGKGELVIQNYQTTYQIYFQLLSDLKKLESEANESKSREDFFQFQLKEISEAELKVGEEEELLQEKKVLNHFSKIHEAVTTAESALYSSSHSVIELLGKTEIAFQKIAGIDPTLDEKAVSIRSVSFEIEEVSRFFQTYLQKNSFDPERLNLIENRLEEISRLKKKYGGSVESVLEKQIELQKQVTLLENFEESLKDYHQKIEVAKKELQKAANSLTQIRKKNAKRLASEMQQELESLSMNQARFEVRINPLKDFSLHGFDQIDFYISTNKGEEPKPLMQIASGGELSRIYLALKSVLKKNAVSSYLFDEVDTGIGGAVAEQVGAKLKALSENSQVICITHLPQIAAFADAHFQIRKIEKKERMITQVRFLEIEERIQEIARMFAGSHITEKALSQAKEMILFHQKKETVKSSKSA